MPDMSFEFILSVGLGIIGVASITRKRFALGIGRPKAIFDIVVTGNRALFFGIVSLVVGSVLTFLCGYLYFTKNKEFVEQGNLSLIIGVGLAITFSTFLLGFFIEVLAEPKNNS